MRKVQFDLCKTLNLNKSDEHFYVLPNRFPEEIFNKIKSGKFGKFVPAAIYFSDYKKNTSEIIIKKGLVFKKDNSVLDTHSENLALSDTYKNFLLVMDRNGKIYASPRTKKSWSVCEIEPAENTLVCQGKIIVNGEEKNCTWLETKENVQKYEFNEKGLILDKDFFYREYKPKDFAKFNKENFFLKKGFLEKRKIHISLKELEIRHSNIIGGEPAAFAGELECVNGKIVSITDRSGHYQPPRQFTKIFIKHLENLGANLNDCKIELILKDNVNLKKFFEEIEFRM